MYVCTFVCTSCAITKWMSLPRDIQLKQTNTHTHIHTILWTHDVWRRVSQVGNDIGSNSLRYKYPISVNGTGYRNRTDVLLELFSYMFLNKNRHYTHTYMYSSSNICNRRGRMLGSGPRRGVHLDIQTRYKLNYSAVQLEVSNKTLLVWPPVVWVCPICELYFRALLNISVRGAGVSFSPLINISDYQRSRLLKLSATIIIFNCE